MPISNDPNELIGQQVIANILLGGDREKTCLVEIQGVTASLHVRVKMIDAAPEVDLPTGVQTILAWDRFPSLNADA